VGDPVRRHLKAHVCGIDPTRAAAPLRPDVTGAMPYW